MIERPEFSRVFRVDQIPAAGVEHDLTADEAERAALARRFGILAVDTLTARIRLKAIAGGTMVRLHGSLSADVVQACVVTLEPVPAHIEEDFELTFGEAEAEDGGEIELSMDDSDPPDPIVNGTVDVGEAVAEHLALALDPFPRKAGATVPASAQAELPAEEKPNPFAVLAQLRQKKE